MKRAAFLLAVALATPAWAGDEFDDAMPRPVPVIKRVPVERLAPLVVRPLPVPVPVVTAPSVTRTGTVCKPADYVMAKTAYGADILTCHPERYTKRLPPVPKPEPVQECGTYASTFSPVNKERGMAPFLAAARADLQAGTSIHVSYDVRAYKSYWVDVVRDSHVAEVTDYKECLTKLRKRSPMQQEWLDTWNRLQTYVQP